MQTSLLNIIGTIDKPTKGEINICGKRITSSTTDREFADLRLRQMYPPQPCGFHLWSHVLRLLTVVPCRCAVASCFRRSTSSRP